MTVSPGEVLSELLGQHAKIRELATAVRESVVTIGLGG